MARILDIKRALARERQGEAVALVELAPGDDLPRPALGEYLAVCALALATVHDVEAARATAAKAITITSTIEAVFFGRFANAVCDVMEDGEAVQATIRRLIDESVRADFFDALIFAYRSSPEFRDRMCRDEQTPAAVGEVMYRANDGVLARRLGRRPLTLRARTLELFTPREREVLALLATGLTNAEIAKRLFIAQSTVKVHVHHILQKLDVKSRLQAVLKARALLERESED
jgi:DNA-binding NarL/FixJ family response regulator